MDTQEKMVVHPENSHLPPQQQGYDYNQQAQYQYPQTTGVSSAAPTYESISPHPQQQQPPMNHSPHQQYPMASPPPAQHSPYQQQPPYQQPVNQQPMAQAPMQPVHGHAATRDNAYGRKGGKWESSFCTCSPCDSCLLSWCVPCVLLGKTSERMRDPSGQSEDLLNSDCIISGLLCSFTGCHWIYTMLKRGEIRERYQIEGSGFGDCCAAFWCHCCILIQQDNEVKRRQAAATAQSGPPLGYQPQQGMQMPNPTAKPAPVYTS